MMKIIYYGFGAFIGFICGSIINLIFFWLDRSGTHFAEHLVNQYDVWGRYLLQLINSLPYFGVAMGIIMVKLLFGKELDSK
ncbi:MAG: hypothetical protein ACE5E9_12525 [Nitrospinaceae bacterium]